jgi:hypothetical protein
MFEGKAEKAMRLCFTVSFQRSIKKAAFTVAGQTVPCADSFVKHAFSFFVSCGSEDEIQRLTRRLVRAGRCPYATRQLWLQPYVRMDQRLLRRIGRRLNNLPHGH